MASMSLTNTSGGKSKGKERRRKKLKESEAQSDTVLTKTISTVFGHHVVVACRDDLGRSLETKEFCKERHTL